MWIIACGINRHSCCVYSPCYNRRLDFFFNTQAAVTFFNLLATVLNFILALMFWYSFSCEFLQSFRCRRTNTIVCNFYHSYFRMNLYFGQDGGRFDGYDNLKVRNKKAALAAILCLKGQKLESKISRKFGDYWQLSEFFTSFSASSSLSSVAIFFGLLWWLRLWRLYPLLFPDHFHALQWICTVFWIMILICINVVEAYILHWPFYILQRLLLLRCCDKSMNCYLFHYCGMLPNV